MKRTKRTLSLLVALAMVLLSATTAFAGTYSIFGDDDRTSVSTTSGTNYSICKIEITFDNGDVEYGTGFLTSSTKVITAGHVLRYKKKDGTPKTAKKLKLYFGCTGTKTANEIVEVDCTSENIYYPSSWASSYGAASDYGAIKLPKEVTGPTKFFTLGTISNSDAASADITITGYENHGYYIPPHYFTNWQLLQCSGKTTGYTAGTLRTRMDTMPGQSGAPVVYKGSVVGIYTYSVNGSQNQKPPYIYPDDSTEYNQITRITSDVQTELINCFKTEKG
ncbi:MAG: trypsin-like serine protease [Angelakisella sp.]|nr:trypsin-like serine protease [Angelakisella sp.]